MMRAPSRRRSPLTLPLLGLLVAIPALPVGAAPPASTVELPAGGLMIAPNPALAIESLEVTLQPDRVRAVYLVRNLEERARTFVMSFALPEIDMQSLAQQPVTIPRLDPGNFVAAEIVVDGGPVAPTVEQRALALGIDVSDQLQTFDLPQFPFAPSLRERLAAMPGAERRRLEASGLVVVEEERVEPLWTVKTVRHWRQEFQPSAVVRVQLTYTPVLGSAPLTAESAAQFELSHCLDRTKANELLAPGPAPAAPRRVHQLAFLLSTGAVLPGPAKTFRLVVEKPAATAMVALCKEGLKPAAGGAMAWEATDFVPDDDITVLFVE